MSSHTGGPLARGDGAGCCAKATPPVAKAAPPATPATKARRLISVAGGWFGHGMATSPPALARLKAYHGLPASSEAHQQESDRNLIREEFAQQAIDDLWCFDFRQMADTLEHLQLSLPQDLEQDRGVLVDRVYPVLAARDHQHRKQKLAGNLLGAVAVREPELDAMHEAARAGRAHHVAHQLGRFRRGLGAQQRADAGAERIS